MRARANASGRGGFSLIELLAAVAILAMLAAVAMVQVSRARITANEQLALTSLRTIARACHFYFLTRQQFPGDLTLLGPPTSDPAYLRSDLIGDGLTARKQGYVFTYAPTAGNVGFEVHANPQDPGVSGTRYFYVAEDLAVHVDPGGPADGGDPVIP
jgi:prepilin-type N-terminal cleavage/methylation domain-containing protein